MHKMGTHDGTSKNFETEIFVHNVPPSLTSNELRDILNTYTDVNVKYAKIPTSNPMIAFLTVSSPGDLVKLKNSKLPPNLKLYFDKRKKKTQHKNNVEPRQPLPQPANNNASDLLKQPIVDEPKQPLPESANNNASDLLKQPIVVAPKQPLPQPANNNASDLLKQPIVNGPSCSHSNGYHRPPSENYYTDDESSSVRSQSINKESSEQTMNLLSSIEKSEDTRIKTSSKRQKCFGCEEPRVQTHCPRCFAPYCSEQCRREVWYLHSQSCIEFPMHPNDIVSGFQEMKISDVGINEQTPKQDVNPQLKSTQGHKREPKCSVENLSSNLGNSDENSSDFNENSNKKYSKKTKWNNKSNEKKKKFPSKNSEFEQTQANKLEVTPQQTIFDQKSNKFNLQSSKPESVMKESHKKQLFQTPEKRSEMQLHSPPEAQLPPSSYISQKHSLLGQEDHKKKFFKNELKTVPLIKDELYSVNAVYKKPSGSVCVQRLDLLESFYEKLIEQCKKYGQEADLATGSLEQGELLCVYYAHENSWLRSIYIADEGELIKVEFLDFGNSDSIPKDCVKCFHPSLLQFPLLMDSVNSALPLDETWLDKCIEEYSTLYLKITEVSPPKGIFSPMESNEELSLSVIPNQSNTTSKPSTSKQPTHVDMSKAVDLSPKYSDMTCKLVQFNECSYIALPVHQEVLVTVTQITNDTFYAVMAMGDKVFEEYNELYDEINKFCSSREKTYYKPEIGEICLAKWNNDGSWYRAAAMEYKDNGVNVLFVDYGNSEVIEFKNICHMMDAFLKPVCAVLCKLTNPEDVCLKLDMVLKVFVESCEEYYYYNVRGLPSST